MKNKIQLLQFVAILIFSFGTYAQVTVSVSDLQYTNDGQSTITLANCGNIDLASSTTTSINLGIDLSKPNGQVVGLSDLRVYTKKSSSDSRIERSWVQISEASWNTSVQPNTRSTSASFSINSSDFNASGGTLFVVFKSSGGSEYTSTCIFTITKALIPSFTLSPTSLILACGDTAEKTFTVSASNIPNGANVSYGWGFTGWNEISRTFNTITLSPASGILLPGNVMVFPTVNGVAYPSKTCTVTRSSIASTGYISGNTTVCSSQTYSLTGLLAGEMVTWNLSNATAGTLSPPNGASTTFTTTADGSTDIIATVSNACGESYTKTLGIFAGLPPSFSLENDLYENQSCDIKYHYVPFIIKKPAGVNLSFEFLYPNASYGISSNGNDEYTYTFAFPKSYSGYFNVSATFTNSCGSSYFETEGEYYIQNCNQIEANSNLNNFENSFVIFPNPANDVVTIELKDSENQPQKESTISGELFDMSGQSKSIVKISDNKAAFSVKGLKKGIYILKIFINDQVENHRIAVE